MTVNKIKKTKEPGEKVTRKLSDETKKKISDARRARTKQPRSGQSKKRQSFYQELHNDYKGNKEALEWLENNKSKIDGTGYEFDKFGNAIDNPGNAQAREIGITTEYSDMYANFYEYSLASVLYGKSVVDNEDFNEEDASDDSCEQNITEMLEEMIGADESNEDDDE